MTKQNPIALFSNLKLSTATLLQLVFIQILPSRHEHPTSGAPHARIVETNTIAAVDPDGQDDRPTEKIEPSFTLLLYKNNIKMSVFWSKRIYICHLNSSFARKEGILKMRSVIRGRRFCAENRPHPIKQHPMQVQTHHTVQGCGLSNPAARSARLSFRLESNPRGAGIKTKAQVKRRLSSITSRQGAIPARRR
jgi:hypothetical protein